MSGNFESMQVRNTLFEGKKCEGKYLADLGHKMATSGYFRGFPSVIDVESHIICTNTILIFLIK